MTWQCLLARRARLVEVDVLRGTLGGHLHSLLLTLRLVLDHDLVLVRDSGRQLAHLSNHDLLAVADELAGGLLKSWVGRHSQLVLVSFILVEPSASLVVARHRGFASSTRT